MVKLDIENIPTKFRFPLPNRCTMLCFTTYGASKDECEYGFGYF